MNQIADELKDDTAGIEKMPVVAALIALIGVADAGYLTVKHFTAEPVPCSIIEGCETVLTSSYAEIGGVPLAAFGAIAYFIAFSLSVLAVFGNRTMWLFLGIQSMLMAAFSAWLVYLQGFVIGAFCQFCLISAATSFGLFIVFLVSKLASRGA